MKHVEELRIKQVHDDCHYETSIEERMRSGFMPIVIGYGCTQEEADTEALKKFSLRQIDEDNMRKRCLELVKDDRGIYYASEFRDELVKDIEALSLPDQEQLSNSKTE